ncbi:MoaD/ThiS family protein [Flexithrix dorotheae]|uniref:MoaD/ThiS family protein n=1 Tax=Flexithrix dorotheae TaxID=70993 RepID=UPI00036EB9F1|nr:MoaD/ThiS family protein [Flexithrix dorotheae]
MAVIQFTTNLKRFYPDLNAIEIDAKTVAELIQKVDLKFPGLKDYVVDEQGKLRKHVNIFIGNNMIKDRETLLDTITEKDEIYIMQALSGG